jgi:hypothetical protein
MTESEVIALIGYINQRWPHAPLEDKSIPVWLEDLEDLPTEECGAAVKRWARSGEKFPPTSGWVHSEVVRAGQAAAPGFDEVGDVISRTLGRALAHELYRPDGAFSPQDTARAIEIMALGGAHEAVMRLVHEKGLRAVVMVPHGEQFGLDRNQSADRRDMARHYEAVTLKGWRDDPAPGRALERARRDLVVGRRGELRAVGELMAGES